MYQIICFTGGLTVSAELLLLECGFNLDGFCIILGNLKKLFIFKCFRNTIYSLHTINILYGVIKPFVRQ